MIFQIISSSFLKYAKKLTFNGNQLIVVMMSFLLFAQPIDGLDDPSWISFFLTSSSYSEIRSWFVFPWDTKHEPFRFSSFESSNDLYETLSPTLEFDISYMFGDLAVEDHSLLRDLSGNYKRQRMFCLKLLANDMNIHEETRQRQMHFKELKQTFSVMSQIG
jgi:hypothetical protein